MLKEICEKAHQTKSKTLVQDLRQELNQLQEITKIIIQSELEESDKKEWLEIMTNYLNGIQHEDKVLLLDCLEYALIPYLEKNRIIKTEDGEIKNG